MAGSYSMLKFRLFCRFCQPRNSEIFGSVLRFGLCSLDRHENFIICRAIYEDQENIYMLGPNTSSRRVSAFRASLGFFFRKSTIAGFFFRTHHIFPSMFPKLIYPTLELSNADSFTMRAFDRTKRTSHRLQSYLAVGKLLLPLWTHI